MPFTQADVDALKRAIAEGKGARTITFSDQSVTFESIQDMTVRLALMEREANSSVRRGYRVAATSKGV
jgi:hypothetical protein